MSDQSSDVLSSTVFDWDEDVRMQEELDSNISHLNEQNGSVPTDALLSHIEEGIRGWTNTAKLSLARPSRTDRARALGTTEGLLDSNSNTDLSHHWADVALEHMALILRSQGYKVEPPATQLAVSTSLRKLPDEASIGLKADAHRHFEVHPTAKADTPYLPIISAARAHDEARVFESLVNCVRKHTLSGGASAATVHKALLEDIPSCFDILCVSTFKQLLHRARLSGVRVKYVQENGEVSLLRVVDEGLATDSSVVGKAPAFSQCLSNAAFNLKETATDSLKIASVFEDVNVLVHIVAQQTTVTGRATGCALQAELLRHEPALFTSKPRIRNLKHYLMHMRQKGAPVRFEHLNGLVTWVNLL